ncbi:hypothetical protein D3C87_2087380 [compost metagenome]
MRADMLPETPNAQIEYQKDRGGEQCGKHQRLRTLFHFDDHRAQRENKRIGKHERTQGNGVIAGCLETVG